MLAPYTRLLGRTIVGLHRLAAVSADGAIPLPGTLALDTDAGFVTLSYGQGGLSCRGPEPHDAIRWDTEPWLVVGASAAAEEWLELVPVAERRPPLAVAEVTGWFGTGPYDDVFGLALSGAGGTLVLTTTDDYGLRPATREETRRRADVVSRNMNQRLIEVTERI